MSLTAGLRQARHLWARPVQREACPVQRSPWICGIALAVYFHLNFHARLPSAVFYSAQIRGINSSVSVCLGSPSCCPRACFCAKVDGLAQLVNFRIVCQGLRGPLRCPPSELKGFPPNHQPSEGQQVVFFNCLDLRHKPPASGERQYKPRA